MLGVLLGVVAGASAMSILPLLGRDSRVADPLPSPERIAGSAGSTTPKVSGDVSTVVRSFSLDDLEGNTVLQVDKPRQLLLYEPEKQRTRLFSPAGPALSTARLSSDGSLLAVGNKEGEVLVYPTSAFD